MRQRIILSIITLCLAVVVLGGFALVRAQTFPGVLSEYILEAGGRLPLATKLLLSPDGLAYFSNKINDVDVHIPGKYPIEIIVTNASGNQKIYQSIIKVIDTIPPQATPVNCVALSGGPVSPEVFVADIADATAVSVSFAGTPDFVTPGSRTINIVLRDLGGNMTAVSAMLTVVGLTPVTMEAGSPRSSLNIYDFTDTPDKAKGVFLETNPSGIDMNRVGTYDICLRLGNSTGETTLEIVDTTPPTAAPVAVEAWIGDELLPINFVTDVFDYSDVTATFSDEPGFSPDFERTGRQTLKIFLTDSSGNTSELETTLTLTRDTEPPVISGDIHKSVFIGDSVAYRAGVIVSDNRDSDVPLSVDSGAVNVYEPGRYPVIYSATDRAGNMAEAMGSVTVYNVEAENVYQMADELLARIINNDMTLEQRARKIFDWVRGNVAYVNANESDGVIFGAYRALTKRSGDCYTFFSISQLLLERAGVPSIPVVRVGGNTRHYWQLIDVGTGWHHYDSTKWNEPVDTFMMSESRAQALARQYQNRNYYNYDEDLYPEVVQ